jgi:alpha-mannosidase
VIEDRHRGRNRISTVLKRVVQPAIYGERIPLAVLAHHVHGEPISASDARSRDYVPIAVGQEWGGAWDTTWFRMRASIPAAWRGSEVVALVDLGGAGMVGFTAEGLVWDGDQPRQGLHLKHRECVVARPAEGGDEIELWIEAAANPIPPWGTSPWPLLMADVDGPPIYRLGVADLAIVRRDVEALYYDMVVLVQLLDTLPEAGARAAQVLHALESACDTIADDDVIGSVSAARSTLGPVLANPAGEDAHRISAVGHAHIDTAWLWPIRETKRKCARTFANALALMDDYPEYRFSASQAQQYSWMKDHYPPLYERLREQVKAGRFEPIGSMWVEADCNLPSGESLVRQIVHGKRFFMDEFDIETTDLWLPDVFGYSAALPQILNEAGISSFLTQKMSWNDINRFPHSTFWWEGIDGTRILTHFPPADTYNGDMSVGELTKGERQFGQHAVSKHSLYPFGFGDGGGGPTRAMLESARRLADLEGAPRVEIGTVASFWKTVHAEAAELPVWVGELYLEYHRGTYTTNGAIKLANRRNEQALRAAELWSVAAASMHGPWSAYPTAALDEAWKLLLCNQFHDIIPGSSIHWANNDCLDDHARIDQLMTDVLVTARQAIVDRIDRAGMTNPVTVFNAASRERTELIEVHADGSPVLVPVTVPACGYTTIDLDRLPPAAPHRITVSERSLENELLAVTWDELGLLTSIFDKANDREVLAAGARANVFQLHDDHPRDFDAWNVDLEYLDQRIDLTDIVSNAVVEHTTQRGAVRFVREFGTSTITQTMRLVTGSRRLDFDTEIEWHERHKFLKVAFPVDVLAAHATYEIQFGHLERPTHTNTTWDVARFEVCAHRWADLSEPGYGVALLNDCKYGYDVHGNVMRLSLLRGPGWPDPQTDQGRHRFSYALFPHAGDLRAGGVVAEAEAFNLPLVAVPVAPDPTVAGTWPSTASVVRADRPNVTVEAVKKADREPAVVVRVSEAWGARGRVHLSTSLPVKSATRVDVLERDRHVMACTDGVVELDLRPFELVTLKFMLDA